MTDPIVVGARRGILADVETIVALYRAGLEAHAVARGGELDGLLQRRAMSADLDSGYREDVESSNTASKSVYVATVDDRVLGYLIAAVSELVSGELLMTVEEIYVEPKARGVGLGKALLDLVVADANALGCRGIDARALPGDRATKNFFESFGMVARAITVHKSLT